MTGKDVKFGDDHVYAGVEGQYESTNNGFGDKGILHDSTDYAYKHIVMHCQNR